MLKKILPYLKFIALIPLLIAFTVLTLNLFELGVLPTKYLIIVIAVEVILVILEIILLSRRHPAPIIIAIVVALLSSGATAYASHYLIVTNQAIADFAATSIVTSDQTGTSDITTEPFVLLINGLDDNGTDNIDGKANSDVNQLVAIDPTTHRILLVNTPRDYYVYLHGVTTMRDKLTHAGYYDLEMSRQTLEDLYNIDIDYYVRINFKTLIGLVDLIGGIDVESEYEFNTTSGTHVKKGWNHFTGKQALAFARERKHFGTGDIKRAEDQQVVMIAIFEKITHSSALLGRFTEILNTLKDSFRTDLPIADLKKLVQMQLDEMPTWDIEHTAVSGTAIMTRDVYSLMPTKQDYYVVVPDEASIQAAREKILTILDLSS